MPDLPTLAGVLLVVGPLVGLVPVANPTLIPIWSAPREQHLAVVGSHRQAWALLNLGFGFATVVTTAGLAVLAAALADGDGRGPALAAAALVYAMGGSCWCAMLAVRNHSTPALAGLVERGEPTEPAESLLGTVNRGLFDAFIVATCAALLALGAILLVSGGVAPIVAALCALTGLAGFAVLVGTGDLIPATLYVPTLVLGIAILVGWT